LKGRPVVTATGHRLGEISDLLVDGQTGAFDALEVASSDFGGLRTKRSQVRPGADIRIGPDAVVVPEGTTRQSERDEVERDDSARQVTIDIPRVDERAPTGSEPLPDRHFKE
jgi:uncharacterized protein YrrD